MKFKKLFLLVLITFASSTHPFFRKVWQATGKARYALSRITTSGYCIGLAYTSFKINYDFFNNTEKTVTPEEFPNLYLIIKNEQTRYGFNGNIEVMEDIKGFQVKSKKLQPHLLSITSEFNKDFLSKAPELVGEKYRGILQHEFGHMKENFLQNGYFKELLLTGIIIIKSLLATKTPLKTAALTTLSTRTLAIILSKYNEQKADDEIEDNIKTLEDFKKHLEKHLDEFPEMIKKEFQLKDNDSDLVKRFCTFLFQILDSHPAPEKRIEKLEQRIAILKDPQGYLKLVDQEQENSVKTIGYLG